MNTKPQPTRELRLLGELTQREKQLLEALRLAGYELRTLTFQRQIVRKAA